MGSGETGGSALAFASATRLPAPRGETLRVRYWTAPGQPLGRKRGNMRSATRAGTLPPRGGTSDEVAVRTDGNRVGKLALGGQVSRNVYADRRVILQVCRNVLMFEVKYLTPER